MDSVICAQWIQRVGVLGIHWSKREEMVDEPESQTVQTPSRLLCATGTVL
jgi:hypothetical protein